MGLNPLTSTRVPVDDCAVDRWERLSLSNGIWTVYADNVIAALEIGKVYGVGIYVKDNLATPPDDPCIKTDQYCRIYGGTVAFNAQLFEALRRKDTDALEGPGGRGHIIRIFIPESWYDFSE